MSNPRPSQTCALTARQFVDLAKSQDILVRVSAHAEAVFDEECCGFITRSGQVHEARNVQSELHANDPERHPRDGRRAFMFAPEDQLALSRSLRSDDPAVCIYHSHPDAGAYFSTKDSADALFHGHPKLPVMHLVMSVMSGRSQEAKLFEFDDGIFVERWCSSTIDHLPLNLDRVKEPKKS